MAEPDGEIPRRLIEAAAEAFARHGFSGTRVRDIVRAADVNLASVNYYFGGKEGLYAATLKELSAYRLSDFPATPAAPRGESAEEALCRHIRLLLDRYVQGNSQTNLGRILAHESMNPTVYFDVLVTEIVRPELEQLRGIVGQLAGGRLEPEALSRCAMSILGQCLFYLFARGAVERLFPDFVADAAGREKLARHIAAFSCAGVREAAG